METSAKKPTRAQEKPGESSTYMIQMAHQVDVRNNGMG